MVQNLNDLAQIMCFYMCVCVSVFGVCVCQDRSEGRVEQRKIHPQLPSTGSQHVKQIAKKVTDQHTHACAYKWQHRMCNKVETAF